MWSIDAPPQLAGGEVMSADGELVMSVEHAPKVVCASCGESFEVTPEYTVHREYPTILCFRCDGIMFIQYDDDSFEPPWEILDMSTEAPTATVSVDGGEYLLFDERSNELSSIHSAGECLARATSMEFPGDGNYSNEAMNTLLVAEHKGTAVGYLTWNTFDSDTSTYPALRQLYFMPAYRRRGLGSILVKYWLKEVVGDLMAETPDNMYCVEQPNEDMIELLSSLGHHDENEGGPTASKYTPNQM